MLSATVALIAFPLATFASNDVKVPTMTSTTTDVSSNYTFTNIPGFNDAMGKLIAVEFTLTLYSQPYVTVYNSNMQAEKFVDATASTEATASLGYSLSSAPLVVDSGVTKAGPFSGTVPGDSTTTELLGKGTKTSDSVVVDDPGTYYSSGKYSLPTKFTEDPGIFGGTTVSGDPGVYFSGGDNLYETLCVEYFYCDCVPEPSTLPLAALSLGVFFLGRRFFLKRASLA